jgi:Rieske Fe-S protein
MSVPIPEGTGLWLSVKFDYIQTNIIFGHNEPTVTKLPGMGISRGSSRKAFSRVCPHLGCTLEFEQSSKKIKMKTGYNPDGSRCKAYITNSPNVDSISTNTAYIYCPCHQSVFKVNVDDKGDMKTEVVQGPATETPEELDVEWVQEIDQPIEARPVEK